MDNLEQEKLAIASRLFVRLRRNSGRAIDVVWLMHNQLYAEEVLKIARADGDPEVQKLAHRLEGLLQGKALPAEAADSSMQDEVASHYIGALR